MTVWVYVNTSKQVGDKDRHHGSCVHVAKAGDC